MAEDKTEHGSESLQCQREGSRAWVSEVQGPPQLQSKFQNMLGYTSFCPNQCSTSDGKQTSKKMISTINMSNEKKQYSKSLIDK